MLNTSLYGKGADNIGFHIIFSQHPSFSWFFWTRRWSSHNVGEMLWCINSVARTIFMAYNSDRQTSKSHFIGAYIRWIQTSVQFLWKCVLSFRNLHNSTAENPLIVIINKRFNLKIAECSQYQTSSYYLYKLEFSSWLSADRKVYTLHPSPAYLASLETWCLWAETPMMQQLQLLVYNCVSAHICYFITTLKLPPATHSAESSACAAATAVLMALQKRAQ